MADPKGALDPTIDLWTNGRGRGYDFLRKWRKGTELKGVDLGPMIVDGNRAPDLQRMSWRELILPFATVFVLPFYQWAGWAGVVLAYIGMQFLRITLFQLTAAPTLKFAQFEGLQLQQGRWYNVKAPGARFSASDLSGTGFLDCDLEGAWFGSANLKDATFSNCRLQGTYFRAARLHRAALPSAVLAGCDFTDAELLGANLESAALEGANLSGANLCAASLRMVRSLPTLARGATIDSVTYQRSEWTPQDLLEWLALGVRIEGWAELPVEARALLPALELGLLLTFSRALSTLDRVLVEGTIQGILGPDADCRLAEYREQDHITMVRLEGSCREDLEAVAQALYHRVWELQEPAQRATLAQLDQPSVPQQTVVNHGSVTTQIVIQGNASFGLNADLAPIVTRLQRLEAALPGACFSDLVDRLERMELRLLSEDAAADQTAAAATRRELKLVRTWDPGTHPRTALDRMLAMLEPDELRLLLARGPDGAEVVALVPAGAVAPMMLASQAADELVRRGLVDEAFFGRVVAARPDLEEAVRRVAGMWRERGV